jgi:hypothetical protein
MKEVDRFFFGIPLIARSSAQNWSSVETLLGLTLASVRAQTDQDFRVVIAGHDKPEIASDDTRIKFLEADWPAEPVSANNLDSGRKKFLMQRFVLEAGGGLLMFLDADDWVDCRVIDTARKIIGPEDIGSFIDTGYATDLRNLRAAPLPHPRIFDGAFHRLCGSSTVARLQPSAPDPLRCDPYAILHEHYRWTEAAREHRASVVRLPVVGNYVVNTNENHSESHGPFAAWRCRFNEAVNREGQNVDGPFLAQFGLSMGQVREALERLP